MPNRRITEFPVMLAGDIVDDDILTLVDVFEVDPSLRNKKITFSGFRAYLDQYFINTTDSNPFPVSGLLVSETSRFVGDAQFDSNVTVSQSVTITGNLDVGGSLQVDNITLDTSTITGLTFVTASGDTITATSGDIANIVATTINTTDISSTSGNTDNFTVNQSITINSGTVEDLVVNNLSATGLLTITGDVSFSKVTFGSGTNLAPSITFVDDDNTGFFTGAANTISVATSGVEHLKVNGNGAIAVGLADFFGLTGQPLVSRGSQQAPIWSSSLGGLTITGGDINIQNGDLLASNNISGLNVYGSVISGSTVVKAPSGNFTETVLATTFTGITVETTTGIFNTLATGVTANFSTGIFTTVTGTAINATTGTFENTNITTATGITASYTTGVFTNLSTSNEFTAENNLIVGNNLEVSGDIIGNINITAGVFSSGTALQPSISFSGDENTGFFTDEADKISVSTGGAARITIGSGTYGAVLTINGNS